MSIIENTNNEFKREFVSDINKTVVAFANTSGGTLYIGIDDDGRIIGIPNIDETMLMISNAIRDSIKPDVTMFVDYEQEYIDNKAIVKVNVQRGTARPYYITGKGIRPEGVYVRFGASTIPATETVILQMIKDTDGEKYEDTRSLNQELNFSETEKEFKSRNIPFGRNHQKTLGLINEDDMYTNLGMLLSNQCIYTVKLAVFKGIEKAVFRDRREFSGSLLKQLNEIYDFIDRYNSNRSVIDRLRRTDKRDYPPEAIREALLNMIVHRDYAFSDSALISIFDNRIEFVSIGGLVRGISYSDILLGVSVARNPSLARVFYRLSLIEAYGTGIPNILRSYTDSDNKPLIEVSDHAFKITLPNMNEVNAVNAASSTTILSYNEIKVMELFDDRDFIKRKDVDSNLNISQAMSVRILKGLVSKKKIKVVGNGKTTIYIPYE